MVLPASLPGEGQVIGVGFCRHNKPQLQLHNRPYSPLTPPPLPSKRHPTLVLRGVDDEQIRK